MVETPLPPLSFSLLIVGCTLYMPPPPALSYSQIGELVPSRCSRREIVRFIFVNVIFRFAIL